MIEKTSLLRKYGFYRALALLPSDGSKITVEKFYEVLNETDYYNLFIRVKKEMLEKGIISFDNDWINENGKEKKRKTIQLTKNGIVLKLRLKEIVSQLDNPYAN